MREEFGWTPVTGGKTKVKLAYLADNIKVIEQMKDSILHFMDEFDVCADLDDVQNLSNAIDELLIVVNSIPCD